MSGAYVFVIIFIEFEKSSKIVKNKSWERVYFRGSTYVYKYAADLTFEVVLFIANDALLKETRCLPIK